MKDSSGNGNTGTLVDGSFYQDRAGLNDSMYFDGENDYFYVPGTNKSDFSFTSQYTVSMWLKLEDITNNWVQLIRNWVPGYVFFVQKNEAGNASIRMATGTGGDFKILATSAVDILDDQWHQVAFRFYYNGTDYIQEIFYDGQSIASLDTGEPQYSSSLDLTVGYNYYFDGGNYYQGLMDEIKFYDEKLDDSVIADQYNYDLINLIGVTPTTTVPEPCTVLLLISGIGSLLLRKRS